jgi:aromatic ring-opening dioxygenase catalytic subunit (LigB family)
MDRESLENAIRTLAGDPKLFARFKAAPTTVGKELGLTADGIDILQRGDRGRLRSLGLNDGLTILVSRWFNDDLGDSSSSSGFYVDTHTPLPKPDLPAGLVFAAACSHVPDLLARPEIDPPDAVQRLLTAYARLGQQLAAADPEVLIVTTDCHFQVFASGAFVVGTGARHEGSMAFFKRPDLNLILTGAPDFAAAVTSAIRARGFEVEPHEHIELDHGLIVPLRQMLPRPDLPVIPIVTQPARCFSPFGARAFGAAIREVVASQHRRVAILATGGLSHWLDPGKFGTIDAEFDTYILDMIRAGRGSDIGNLEPYPLLNHGQYEFLNWLIMFGMVGPGVRGEVYAYEALQASGGGWAVVNMLLNSTPAHA